MILNRPMRDDEKANRLLLAGWMRVRDATGRTTWRAPNCIASYQSTEEAYQAYVLGVRCEEPLVRR